MQVKLIPRGSKKNHLSFFFYIYINPIGIQITVGNNLNSVAIFMHHVRNIFFHPLKISIFFWRGGGVL